MARMNPVMNKMAREAKAEGESMPHEKKEPKETKKSTKGKKGCM